MSKIQFGFPQQITDVESIEHRKIKAQNYKIKAKYQSGRLFVNKLFVMPKQEYEYRYFIFLAIDTIKNNPTTYIVNLEKEIEDYIANDTEYDRQNNSCVHPILAIFAKLTKELYKSAVPQAVAVDVMKALLNELRVVYAKFLSMASLTGLDETPYKSSAHFEEIFVSDNQNDILNEKSFRK